MLSVASRENELEIPTKTRFLCEKLLRLVSRMTEQISNALTDLKYISIMLDHQWCSYWGVKGGRVLPLTAKKREYREKGKIGKRGQIGKVLSLYPS